MDRRTLIALAVVGMAILALPGARASDLMDGWPFFRVMQTVCIVAVSTCLMMSSIGKKIPDEGTLS